MQKLLLPFLFVALIMWLLGGSWWYAQSRTKVETPTPLTQQSSTPFLFDDGEVHIRLDDNFSFFVSSHFANIPDELNNSFYQIVEHLNQHPEKSIIFTGYYLSDEQNNSSFANLGLARAEALKSRFIRLGLDGNRIVTQGQVVEKLNLQQNLIQAPVSFEIIEKKAADGQL